MAVVATGFFDGVHLGHRHLIETLTDEAHRRNAQSLIVTFWPHPRNVLQNGARELRLLTSLQEKKELLTALGVDRIEVLDFTKEFSALTMEQYVRQVLIGRFGAECLVLGYDNRMGRDCTDPEQIVDVARAAGLEVVRPGALQPDGALRESCASPDDLSSRLTPSAISVGSPLHGASAQRPISSTLIRSALAEGRVDDASSMLGRPYRLHGVVVAGKQLGRRLGYPTANMQLYEPLKAIPSPGVYAVWAETLEGRFKGMCNIGYRPTVDENAALTIETHLLDFDEDIYGLDLTLDFVTRIRQECKFASLEALSAQLGEDKRTVGRILR